MTRTAARVALLGLGILALAACTRSRPRDVPKFDPAMYVAALPSASPTPAAFAWANGAELSIIVRKRERTLTLYRQEHQERVYPIVLGIAYIGPKTYQGDLRTPEGVYRISYKREHPRWSRFMLLSYPNDVDRQRYAMALGDGRVPIIDGHAPGLGGEVGIHGTDREDQNLKGIDWTWGCVSLLNQHGDELYARVPLGTPVKIEE